MRAGVIGVGGASGFSHYFQQVAPFDGLGDLGNPFIDTFGAMNPEVFDRTAPTFTPQPSAMCAHAQPLLQSTNAGRRIYSSASGGSYQASIFSMPKFCHNLFDCLANNNGWPLSDY